MSTQQHPAAWAVFADNGNVRLWSTDHAEVRAFAEGIGQPLIALYPGPPAQPAPHDDPIGNACRLLRDAAQEYAEGVSVNGVPDWKNEPDTHSAYIEHITAAHRLEQWAASIGAGGVEPLRRRDCLHKIAEPARAAPAFIDSTPELHVGGSAFESWYSDYLLNAPVHQPMKQRARDAYAAGMGDPLVVTAPAAVAGPSQETCQTCQGNGEVVTDWERYKHPLPGDVGDEAVAECQDCDGQGTVDAAPTTQAEPQREVFDEEGFRAWVIRNLPDNTIIGNGEWWANHIAAWVQRFMPAAPHPAPVAQGDAAQPRLTVRLTSFPESNGKRNWTAMFVRAEKFAGLLGNVGGITIAHGELWSRVAYAAECARFLIGERDTEPCIFDYSTDIQTPDEWQGETRRAARAQANAKEGGAA